MNMDPIEMIELLDCPICGGPGVMFDEGGWALNVQCCDCGAHTAVATYKPEDRMEVAKSVAQTWNVGKVIKPGIGD